jgi:hypothetical protein
MIISLKCSTITDNGLTKQVRFVIVPGKEDENYTRGTPSGEFAIAIDAETKMYNYFSPNTDYTFNID